MGPLHGPLNGATITQGSGSQVLPGSPLLVKIKGQNMSQANFDVFCPECNILVASKVIAEGYGGFTSPGIDPLEGIETEYHGDRFFITICGRCGQPFLIKQSLYEVAGEFSSITDEIILYPSETKLIPEGLPKPVGSAYDQAVRSFKASLFEPCVLMCRKCLEATCRKLEAEGLTLDQRLAALAKAGHIDSRLSNWAHEIRLIGNEAAHEIDISVDKDDARDALDFTEAILIYIFSLTKRYESLKSRRANRENK